MTRGSRARAVYESPEAVRFRLGNFDVGAAFRGAFNEDAQPHRWTITERAWLTITASSAQHFDRFHEPMESLRLLFELALDT
jgi:hypothetical protein